ncbi:MAG TPA: AmmeMemoRadiSam system protein A [Gammaproteobacteria bacterium]|nr:AmmeMemoRadiSam system protein A [Gammaproteobacteria bacterium]
MSRPPEEAPPPLSAGQRRTLLDIARRSIVHGLEHGRPLEVDPAIYEPRLRAPGASFVTLQLDGRLRGCIGSLEAHRPLVRDVAANAFAAAFQDPRFPPLVHEELAALHIHISVLGAPSPLDFTSEADLLRQLRPGVDGLILEAEGHRGTFLPSVWESLPEPREFLRQLKLKAGLPPDYWSDRVRVLRYTTESFGE